MTKRFRPIASSVSAVGFSVSGDQAQASRPRGQRLGRHQVLAVDVGHGGRLADVGVVAGLLPVDARRCVHMALMGMSALRFTSMPSPMKARPPSCDSV